MDVAMTNITANRSHVEGLNGFVSMRISIVVRHRNVDGVHRITPHALQGRYTQLLARATALSAVWQLGQSVTGRSPCSLELGMFGVA